MDDLTTRMQAASIDQNRAQQPQANQQCRRTRSTPQQPTMSINVDDNLADLLRSTDLNGQSTEGTARQHRSRWVTFPPGTSTDDQLLILAGAYEFVDARQTYGTPIPELPPTPPMFGQAPPSPPSENVFRNISLDSRNIDLSQMPGSEQAEYRARIRKAVVSGCSWMLDCKPDELADHPMPTNMDCESDLCQWISDQMWTRWHDDQKLPVFAPEKHYWSPCWMSQHPINDVIKWLKHEWDVSQTQKRQEMQA